MIASSFNDDADYVHLTAIQHHVPGKTFDRRCGQPSPPPPSPSGLLIIHKRRKTVYENCTIYLACAAAAAAAWHQDMDSPHSGVVVGFQSVCEKTTTARRRTKAQGFIK